LAQNVITSIDYTDENFNARFTINFFAFMYVVWRRKLIRGWQQSRPTADRPSTDTRCAPVNFDAERKQRETHRWFRRIFGASQAGARREFAMREREIKPGLQRRSFFYIWHICCQVLADGQRVEFRVFLPYFSRLLRSSFRSMFLTLFLPPWRQLSIIFSSDTFLRCEVTIVSASI